MNRGVRLGLLIIIHEEVVDKDLFLPINCLAWNASISLLVGWFPQEDATKDVSCKERIARYKHCIITHNKLPRDSN